MPPPQPIWDFAPANPEYNSLSGDLAKTFKGTRVKAPAMFGPNKPDDGAALLMRETTQDAWNSARKTNAASSPENHALPFILTDSFLGGKISDSAQAAEQLVVSLGGLERHQGAG